MESAVYALVLLMLWLIPSRGQRDEAFRFENAEAIADVTDDAHEREVLVRIASLESGLRRNVARCDIKGDRGKSLGTYQVQPMSRADAKLACGSPREQAGLALKYVRRSAEMCPGSKGAAKLNLYVSGKCWPKALAQAVARWGTQDDAQDE